MFPPTTPAHPCGRILQHKQSRRLKKKKITVNTPKTSVHLLASLLLSSADFSTPTAATAAVSRCHPNMAVYGFS